MLFRWAGLKYHHCIVTHPLFWGTVSNSYYSLVECVFTYLSFLLKRRIFWSLLSYWLEPGYAFQLFWGKSMDHLSLCYLFLIAISCYLQRTRGHDALFPNERFPFSMTMFIVDLWLGFIFCTSDIYFLLKSASGLTKFQLGNGGSSL
jgi:hypothetical protein